MTYLHPRAFMLCLVEIGQMVQGERIISDINVFLVLNCLERAMVLVLKLTCKTFNQEYSVFSFVEFCFIALEEKIVAWHHCIFAVSSVSTLRKGPDSVFELTWFVFHKDKLCCVFFQHGPVILDGKILIVKIIDVFKLFFDIIFGLK